MKPLLVIILFTVLAGSVAAQEIKKIKIGDLQTYIRQSDHPLVINFWATFCVPCVKEIPDFQAVIASHKNDGVELLLVSLDLPEAYPTKITSFAKDKNFSAPIVWLNETNADYFCPKVDKKWTGGIPSTLFVNNKKNYRKFFESELSRVQLEDNINKMLN